MENTIALEFSTELKIEKVDYEMVNRSEKLHRNKSLKRRKQCGECLGCKSAKCGQCQPCNNPKMKTRCVTRKCEQLKKPSKSKVVSKKVKSVVHSLSTQKKIINCEFCPFATHQMKNLNKHYRTEHPESLKCNSCKYTNVRRKKVIAHINMVHNRIKPLKCSDCSYECALKGNFVKHVLRHHDKDKKLKCPECTYTTIGMYEMKKHFRFKHLQIIDYQCQLCGLATFTNGKLRTHIKAVHDKIKDELCDMCSAKFTCRYNLKAHIKAVHLKIKDFKCIFCPFETDRRRNLKYHVEKKHSDERNSHMQITSKQTPPSIATSTTSSACTVKVQRIVQLDKLAAN